MRNIPKRGGNRLEIFQLEEGTYERHSKREEETDRRYSSWKKEQMRHIPKKGGN